MNRLSESPGAQPSFEDSTQIVGWREAASSRAKRAWTSIRSWLFSLDWFRVRLPPLLLVTLFIVTGLRGIDFGYHWDEREWQLLAARSMVANGLFLSRPYTYPGLSKWLVMVPSLDEGLQAVKKGSNIRQVLATMAAAFDAPRYLLQARSVFVVVSSLGILWIFWAVWFLTRRWWQAILAAAILGLSWELAYHSRWLVTDCILAQFSALCLLFLALHHRRGHSGWLWAAAIAAGFAAGTKYPGAILVGPVMLCAALQTGVTFGRRLATVFAVGAISVASFLVTTPGTVLDPINFVEGYAIAHGGYAKGHIGYTVPIGFPLLGVLLRYLTLNLFSPYMPIAVFFFAATLAGGALYWREDRRLAAFLTGFPVLFAVVFCWKYPVFLARNFLLLAPFLAVLSARGVAEALLRLRWPAARVALVILVCGALTANAAWLISAGESIRHRNDRVWARDAVTYVSNHPHTRFRLSPKVSSLALAQGLKLPPNAVQDNPDEVAFFVMAEGASADRWLVNDPWLTRAMFGAWDVNINYYSTWQGSDRVIVMTLAKARGCSAPVAK